MSTATGAGGHGAGDGAPGAREADAGRSWTRPPRRSTLLVLIAAVVAGAGVRAWQVGGRPSLAWNDTTDFLAGSTAPWLSLDLWAGARPPTTSVVLKALGGDTEAYVVWQAALAAVCWAVLAASLATVLAGRARWLAALAVVGLSVTVPVTMWERSVLSESPAVSLLALVVAAGVQVARGATGWRSAALLAALGLWLATRDSHAVVALVGGGSAVAAAGASRLLEVHRVRASVGDGSATGGSAPGDQGTRGGRGAARRALAGLGLAAVVLGLATMLASSHGERHAFPLRNVYEVRVLPYPDRVRWFADHGMPQAEVFTGPDARPPHVEPGGPPVMYVGDDDAQLGPWLDWVETDGRAAFAEFVATHPLYLVAEPLRSPERAFNNAHGDRGFYAPADMPRAPLVDRVLNVPTAFVLLVAALAGGWAAGRRRWTPVLVVGLATAGLAVPHGLVAWHSDGMETARHLVVPAIQLHLGVLLAVIGVLAPSPTGGDAEGPPRQVRHTSGKPRSRLGRSRPPSASITLPVT